jgi:hypothetical protein
LTLKPVRMEYSVWTLDSDVARAVILVSKFLSSRSKIEVEGVEVSFNCCKASYSRRVV